jgi:hypothetical protein
MPNLDMISASVKGGSSLTDDREDLLEIQKDFTKLRSVDNSTEERWLVCFDAENHEYDPLCSVYDFAGEVRAKISFVGRMMLDWGRDAARVGHFLNIGIDSNSDNGVLFSRFIDNKK